MRHNIILNDKQFNNWKEAMDVLEGEVGDQVAVRYLEKRKLIEVTADHMYSDIHRRAWFLQQQGLSGMHIGLTGANSYELLVSFCAVLYMGSVAVVISNDYTSAEIREYGRLAELDALIFDPELEEKCAEFAGEWKLYCLGSCENPAVRSLTSVLSDSEIGVIENHTRRGDLINVLFTSGTTGKSKAVMHSNATLMAGCLSSLFYYDYDAGLVLFPFHHVAGYGFALSTLCKGNIVCLGDGPQNIARYLKEMKPDATFVVPALLQVICQKLEKKKMEDLGWNLKVIICGGAKFNPVLLNCAMDNNLAVFQNYGSSESLGRGFSCRVSRDNPDTLGKIDPIMEVTTVGGELAIKGPTVCMGYLNNQQETAETFRDGWYYTGDLARIDENGYGYLTGRKKNLIILSNGENISPEEIEQTLSANPEIREILVREEDDRIGAVIYPSYPDMVSEKEKEALKQQIYILIERYNKGALSSKKIHHVTITDQPLPKTASQKIIRY